MATWYPQFLLSNGITGAIRWRGRITPFRTSLLSFGVVVEYRLPQNAVPTVWVTDPEISRRTHFYHPHLHANGSVCSFFPPDRTYDPEHHDISTLIDLVADWLRRHLFWSRYGWWPGPEAPHSPAEVLGALRATPDARCICGSERPFTRCCKARYVEIAAQASPPVRMTACEARVRRTVEQILATTREAIGARDFAASLPGIGPPPSLIGGGGKYETQRPRHAVTS
jgi:hypothetical protein